MAQVDNAHNPRAVQGNNEPPSSIDLGWSTYREVSGFLAESPVIQDEDTARKAKLLWDRSKVSLDEMETDRDGQVRPLNTQVKDINATFKEATGPLAKLKDELQSRMSAFALAEERRKAVIAAEARRVAEEAEAAARAAEQVEQEAIANAEQGEFTDVGDAIGEANDAFAAYEKTQREAARAERDVKGRIGGGIGRAFSVRTTRTLTITDPVKVVVAIVEKTGRVSEKVNDALLTAVRDFEKTFGSLPAGVSVEHVRG
ncbi:hypothetical protein [Bosea sp. LjRoot237]|uniref:hypothetical protein n=1 Tax=Bosea sp. LjRoot237 TaxID=3342292 RepID=UPI003ECEE32F